MKRLLALIASLCILLSLTSCGIEIIKDVPLESDAISQIPDFLVRPLPELASEYNTPPSNEVFTKLNGYDDFYKTVTEQAKKTEFLAYNGDELCIRLLELNNADVINSLGISAADAPREALYDCNRADYALLPDLYDFSHRIAYDRYAVCAFDVLCRLTAIDKNIGFPPSLALSSTKFPQIRYFDSNVEWFNSRVSEMKRISLASLAENPCVYGYLGVVRLAEGCFSDSADKELCLKGLVKMMEASSDDALFVPASSVDEWLESNGEIFYSIRVLLEKHEIKNN